MKLSFNALAARCLAPGLTLCVAFFAPAAAGQEGAGAAAADGQAIEELTVVGSRRRDRSAADSPVPVDVIGSDDLRNLGDADMDSLLAALVPSYNVDTQPISDAATVIRPASLRGLPSDATLVLVNGKRRHRGSVITWLGGGTSDGSHGPDVAAIPAIALERVEVLRDGAAAQYGSDAIAGVINFVLREDNSGGSLEARWGRHYEGDGDTFTVSGNVGLPLMGSGFVNLSGEFRQADPTSRSIQRADAQGLIDAGNVHVRQPAAQIWGAPEVRDDWKLFANLGFDVGENSEFYAFGNWAQRTAEGGFFFRNPHTRGGVFRGPFFDAAGSEGNVVSEDDGVWYYADGTVFDGDPVATVRVADISADPMTRIDNYGATVYSRCPQIVVTGDVADAAAISAVSADPNCFSFIERFPGGFTPQFGGDVVDLSLALGLRGNLANDWFYDVSLVVGRNEVEHFMHNTINPQLAGQGVNIPTTYFPQAYVQADQVFDVNLSKPLDLGMAAPLHVALGFEWRNETFERSAGDRNSWCADANDPAVLCDGDPAPRSSGLGAQGFGVGSNGFPGLAPRHAGEESRSSYAAYIDVETNLTDELLVGAAMRFEDYEDFGDTFDGKFTVRYQLSDALAVRGSYNTGFRAPTVGQSTVRNVSTVFGANGLEDRVTLPPTNPISMQKGAVPLTPEESVNTTLGVVWSNEVADITLDYYSVAVEDRIAQSSTLTLTDDDIAALLALGVTDATSFASVRFFTNDFDTTTRGVDLVVTAPLNFGPGDTTLILAANRSDTDVDRRNPDVIGDDRVLLLRGALPGNRFSATLNHLQGDWRWLLRVRRYGEFYGAPADVAGWSKDYEARFMVDLEAGYTINESVTVVLGAQNAADEYPDETTQGAQDGVGMLYPENSPYGFNGGFYYLRAIWDFD